MNCTERWRKLLESRREIDPVTNCWVFIGQWSVRGYGMVQISYKPQIRKPAHCIAAHLWLGVPLHGEHIIAHDPEKCQIRACFNPEHLLVFNNRSEYTRAISKHNVVKSGEENPNSRMTLQQAIQVRDLLIENNRLGKRSIKVRQRIAKAAGVSLAQVQRIQYRTSWVYIWKEYDDSRR